MLDRGLHSTRSPRAMSFLPLPSVTVQGFANDINELQRWRALNRAVGGVTQRLRELEAMREQLAELQQELRGTCADLDDATRELVHLQTIVEEDAVEDVVFVSRKAPATHEHECRACFRRFSTKRGLSIHRSLTKCA